MPDVIVTRSSGRPTAYVIAAFTRTQVRIGHASTLPEAKLVASEWQRGFFQTPGLTRPLLLGTI